MSNPQQSGRRFPSPFAVETPAGAEGWQRMYPYYLIFSEENRAHDDAAFWFRDSMHLPEVLLPFETETHEGWRFGLSVFNARVFAVPPAFGLDVLMLNGYQYTTGIPVTDADLIAQRAQVFTERAGYYFANWDRLFTEWKQKAERLIVGMSEIEVPLTLPDLESDAAFRADPSKNTGYKILSAFDRLMDANLVGWHYHFEMLNIGYAAYLNLFAFCREAFPNIKDQTIAYMVAGTDILYFRPDDELKRLAKLGLDLDLVPLLRKSAAPLDILRELGASKKGEQWIAAFEKAREPWFHLSTGSSLYTRYPTWNEDLRVPWRNLLAYVEKIEKGESIERPTAALRERRDRLAAEYRSLLDSEEDRATFDQNIGLARTVAAYVEDHAFYMHDWFHAVFWKKVREFGAVLAGRGFLADANDVFYLNRWELPPALWDAVTGWAVNVPVRGTHGYWSREVTARKRMIEVLRNWSPPPALGPVPDAVTDPIVVMLFGVTPDRIEHWYDPAGASADTIRGVPGSAGTIKGRARVIHAIDELDQVRDREVLVCMTTEPAWTSIFSRISATVSDIGGVMCHSAIVSREYGLPAVVGTGDATKKIKTGDLVQVDGTNGVVTILERATPA